VLVHKPWLQPWLVTIANVKCSNCGNPMTDWTLSGRLGNTVAFDVCVPCQAFWFDHYNELQFSSASTLELLKYIGERSSSPKPVLAQALWCPRCGCGLTLAHDIARNVHFTYWNCPNQHGHFITFFEFLKEKNFIHPLSPKEIAQLRESVRTVNCSSCGAPIDLATSSACSYCHAPISVLDLKEQQRMLEQLKQAAIPKPVDPTYPLKLAMIENRASEFFQAYDRGWWQDGASADLVQAGLNAVIRWLGKAR
jgi:hypothetical protein